MAHCGSQEVLIVGGVGCTYKPIRGRRVSLQSHKNSVVHVVQPPPLFEINPKVASSAGENNNYVSVWSAMYISDYNLNGMEKEIMLDMIESRRRRGCPRDRWMEFKK